MENLETEKYKLFTKEEFELHCIRNNFKFIEGRWRLYMDFMWDKIIADIRHLKEHLKE